ncbi:MAG: polymer-forming cytoskeletal protein [Gemmatimonadota bacterium]
MSIFANPRGSPSGTDTGRRGENAGLSIIASGTTIIGDIETDGVVKIEGRVQGTIRAGGQVLVAKGGVIQGDVFTREAVIGGEIQGSVHAEERVEIQSGAVVSGDILTLRILIADGGRVNGVITMGDSNGAQSSDSSGENAKKDLHTRESVQQS